VKRRVAVMSPQTRLALAQRRHDRPWRRPQLDPVAAERAVIFYRRQLARAVTALVLLFALLFGLPMVLAVWPELDTVRFAGIPVSWLMLAVLPYPAMVVLGRWQLRRAEAAERTEPVSPPAEVVERLGPVAVPRAEPSRVKPPRGEPSWVEPAPVEAASSGAEE
jgi:hypothetical protein